MRTMRERISSQYGVVSLLVTLIMMIVITLIVLGFAEIARNEQRSTLDEQLSTQAYYAAESGVNDARTIINAAIAAGGPASVPSNDSGNCANLGSYATLNPVVDSAHNVAYTCLIVDATPDTLSYTVSAKSKVIPLIPAGPAFGTIIFDWKIAAGLPTTATGCYTALGSLDSLPVAAGAGQWGCNFPMLRVDILDSTAGLNRASWGATTATMFLVPFDSNSVNNNVTLAARGTMVPARCTATDCIININGLGGTGYYARVTALYQTDSLLTISAVGGKEFVGAQATIDATGRAQDVLRRVRVAVDLTDANAYRVPSAAIVVRDSICKRFSVSANSFQVYNDIDMSLGAQGDAYCLVTSLGSPVP